MSSASSTVTDTAEKKKKEKIDWLSEIRGLALMLLAVLGFHSFIAKPFYIPSESMLPNLLVGDRLVVSKYPYGWSWASISFHLMPRGEWRVWPGTPEYGDIVIPVHPVRDEDYIKRVVGLPGDTFEVRGGQIVIDGAPVPQEVEPPLRIPIDANMQCDFGGDPRTGMPLDYTATLPDGTPVCEPPTLRETLPNGATYLVIDHKQQTLDDFGPIVIPEGHVMVMGDNRDHSADSRAYDPSGLMGPVPLENVGGRAEFITFSLDGTTGFNPISWFTSLRGGRAWSTLRPAIADRGTESERD